MTPAAAIDLLDRQLAMHDEKVTVRRYTAQSGTPRPKIDIEDVPAFVRVLKPEELVAGVDQTFSNVVLSPSALANLLPLKKGDKVVIQGRERNIEFPKPVLLGNVPVRINLLVAG